MEERTFIAIKPDAVQRGLIGKIISRIEEKGYKIVALKMLQVTPEQAAKHYEEHFGKPFYPNLVKFITSAPIVAMVVEGRNVIAGMRQIMGKTNPADADIGTIRGDFSPEMSFNVIHGSDGPESAKREIAIYFNENEICGDWKTAFEILREKMN
ncbi:MAG: nucleoside-diphosphate kinase [Spirochaetales bacterium]|jgi:nucleoside-diphosphate kinase|nr:nucleoside-diphosphate kinase [Spirochaetales bacterium]